MDVRKNSSTAWAKVTFSRRLKYPAKLGGVEIRDGALTTKKGSLGCNWFFSFPRLLQKKKKLEMSPSSSTHPPKSITELNLLAKVHTDQCIPTDIYVNSANLLLKQARIYFREENEEQAYVYYLKYIK